MTGLQQKAHPVMHTFIHARTSSPQSDLSNSPSNLLVEPERGSLCSPNRKSKKKVNFIDSPVLVPDLQPLSSPRHNETSSPAKKSILKSRPAPIDLSSDDGPQFSLDLSTYASFSQLLHSVISALSMNDSLTKMDAYLTLNNAVRQTTSIADANLLRDVLPILLRHIQRDILFPNDVIEGCESRVSTQALKLFSLLSSSDMFVEMIDCNIADLILNISVDAIESATVKKSNFVNHLIFLSMQLFPYPRIFTEKQARRILAVVLKTKTKSKSIEASCCRMLEHLVCQCKSLMLETARDWLPRCLLNSFDDSLGPPAALETLKTASHKFFGLREFSWIVCEVLDSRESSGHATLAERCFKQVERLFENKHESQLLDIWEVLVVLLMSMPKGNSGLGQLDKWQYYGQLLEIARLCLNSSDVSIRSSAILIWQRLAYVWITFSAVTSEDANIRLVLKRRIIILEAVFRFFRQNQVETVNSLVDLFTKCVYLSLTPISKVHVVKQCDFVWQHLVIPVLQEKCLQWTHTYSIAAKIVNLLLQPQTKKLELNSAHDVCFSSIPIASMPKLDAKWIRQRSNTVLSTLLKFFKAASVAEEENLCISIWTSYLRVIISLSQREVHPSVDTMIAINEICRFLTLLSKLPKVNPLILKTALWLHISMIERSTIDEAIYRKSERSKNIQTLSSSLLSSSPPPSFRLENENQTSSGQCDIFVHVDSIKVLLTATGIRKLDADKYRTALHSAITTFPVQFNLMKHDFILDTILCLDEIRKENQENEQPENLEFLSKSEMGSISFEVLSSALMNCDFDHASKPEVFVNVLISGYRFGTDKIMFELIQNIIERASNHATILSRFMTRIVMMESVEEVSSPADGFAKITLLTKSFPSHDTQFALLKILFQVAIGFCIQQGPASNSEIYNKILTLLEQSADDNLFELWNEHLNNILESYEKSVKAKDLSSSLFCNFLQSLVNFILIQSRKPALLVPYFSLANLILNCGSISPTGKASNPGSINSVVPAFVQNNAISLAKKSNELTDQAKKKVKKDGVHDYHFTPVIGKPSLDRSSESEISILPSQNDFSEISDSISDSVNDQGSIETKSCSRLGMPVQQVPENYGGLSIVPKSFNSLRVAKNHSRSQNKGGLEKTLPEQNQSNVMPDCSVSVIRGSAWCSTIIDEDNDVLNSDPSQESQQTDADSISGSNSTQETEIDTSLFNSVEDLKSTVEKPELIEITKPVTIDQAQDGSQMELNSDITELLNSWGPEITDAVKIENSDTQIDEVPVPDVRKDIVSQEQAEVVIPSSQSSDIDSTESNTEIRMEMQILTSSSQQKWTGGRVFKKRKVPRSTQVIDNKPKLVEPPVNDSLLSEECTMTLTDADESQENDLSTGFITEEVSNDASCSYMEESSTILDGPGNSKRRKDRVLRDCIVVSTEEMNLDERPAISFNDGPTRLNLKRTKKSQVLSSTKKRKTDEKCSVADDLETPTKPPRKRNRHRRHQPINAGSKVTNDGIKDIERLEEDVVKANNSSSSFGSTVGRFFKGLRSIVNVFARDE
ncbi:Rap1-interacting factor 1 N terminal-domain-containing protein [Lipomyces japonicus]|uniref:Rap1-interacting factor 1 N terminal-domain-containing protein n=1 Tax=Lipomyces japonicus TaxID=56871 RepID=UPI0034CDE8A0